MCLFTTQKEPKIATKDMVVYKEIITSLNRNNVFASYFRYMYERDVLNHVEIEHLEYIPEQSSSIPFDGSAKVILMNEIQNGTKMFEVNQGFHACLFRNRISVCMFRTDDDIARFIIPKGAEYYTDESGLIVSNKIIYRP